MSSKPVIFTTPTKTTKQLFLKEHFGVDLAKALETNHCVADNMPRSGIGCGRPITTFRDKQSAQEYRQSGLCQACQDKLFNCD